MGKTGWHTREWMVVASLLSVSAAPAELLLVDDFLDGAKPNALGGDFGAWNRDESDPTQRCVDRFNRAQAYGGVGYALQLDYDVDSPNPAYNGFWMKLQGVDLRPYRTLLLAAKGDAERGFTTQCYLELKNPKETGRYLLTGITATWKEFRIPLSAFQGLSDRSAMTELVVVFDDLHATKKVGTIYLDELAFER